MWQGLDVALIEVEKLNDFITKVKSGLVPDSYNLLDDMTAEGWAGYQLIFLYLSSKTGEQYGLPSPDKDFDNDLDYNLETLSETVMENISTANLEWNTFRTYIDDDESIDWLKEFACDPEFEQFSDTEELLNNEMLLFSSERVGQFLNSHTDKENEPIMRLLHHYAFGHSYGNSFFDDTRKDKKFAYDEFLLTGKAIYYGVTLYDDFLNMALEFRFETHFIMFLITEYMNWFEAGGRTDEDRGNEQGADLKAL